MNTQNKRESEIDFGRPLDIEGGFLGQPLAPPPLAIPRKRPMPRAAKIGLGGIVVALIASISVMAFALTHDAKDPDEAAKWKIIHEVETELAAIKARIAAEKEAETTVVEPSTSAEPTAGSSISKAEEAEPSASAEPTAGSSISKVKKPIKKPVKKPVVEKKPVEKKPVETVQPDTKPKDDLDKLLNPDKKPGLPKTLSRKQVQAGMNAVAGSVKSCGQGQSGSITVMVTIKNNGKVAGAQVLGSHAGTPTGSCATRYVRRAKFPAFADPSLRVKYPFSL